MAPFFMSLVGSSDHWMFIASNGALTAGRKNPANALFPYYSADKLIDLAQSAGPQTIVRTTDQNNNPIVWQPFSNSQFARGPSSIQRCVQNLYKNIAGSKLHLEETNLSLGLIFRYSWEFSDRFGFVRKCHLANVGKRGRQIELIDGIHNIMPHGMDDLFQMRYSNLGDAYKKNELLADVELGLFYMSSIPSDRAEPSEGLRSTVVWQTGLPQPTILLSDRQLERFCNGCAVQTEMGVRGLRGAYLVHSSFELASSDSLSWTLVADLKHDQTDVANLADYLKQTDDKLVAVDEDIRLGQSKLLKMISAADGVHASESLLRSHRHQSNVTFNLMRGGTPFQGYDVDTADFLQHIEACNRLVFEDYKSALAELPAPTMPAQDLWRQIDSLDSADLRRIAFEYLPFTFGRRHGDPTRPWNQFSIDVKNEDGSQRLGYAGNWRDIFQNWEALGVSYPHFFNSMVLRFVNASTADGYNPYRISKVGFDWERPDPEGPWANIGYWGDHQIIYLQKLLEWSSRFFPGKFQALLTREVGVYAELPYRIRSYEAILQDSYLTIDYDLDVEKQIKSRVEKIGADGMLLTNQSCSIHRVSLLEKLLVPALVKMTNLVPGGGIWLNTQRPEWNDANNALVGIGASVVTVCHLRRFFCFLKETLHSAQWESAKVSQEVVRLFDDVMRTMAEHAHLLGDVADEELASSRRKFVDQMQILGEAYRKSIYSNGMSGDFGELNREQIVALADRSIEFLDQTILQNRRPDGLFHAYNLLRFTSESDQGHEAGEIQIEYLYEMLEGQVAALSSQLLPPEESVEILDALRASRIYREDLNSYLLYPDRELPKFTEKNCLDQQAVESSKLIVELLCDGNQQIVRRDVNGDVHFNGDLRNANELSERLQQLAHSSPQYAELIEAELDQLSDLFVQTFDHSRFTGRSGTFFGYEGLGCIYWHMVSKLALAIVETYDRATEQVVAPEILAKLKSRYREIRDGLGLESSPELYGAFPTDPYSHTPGHAGAQQPGMTGQVKEDVLSRMAEIGVRIREGIVIFEPSLFESSEFLTSGSQLNYVDSKGNDRELHLSPGSFAFTLCQVPIVFRLSDQMELRVQRAGGNENISRNCNQLNAAESESLFMRDGTIEKIEFGFVPIS